MTLKFVPRTTLAVSTMLRGARARAGSADFSDIVFLVVVLLAFRILTGFSLFSTPHHHGALVHEHGAGGMVHRHGEGDPHHHHPPEPTTPAREDTPEPTPEPLQNTCFSAATMVLHVGAGTVATAAIDVGPVGHGAYVDHRGRGVSTARQARAPPASLWMQTR